MLVVQLSLNLFHVWAGVVSAFSHADCAADVAGGDRARWVDCRVDRVRERIVDQSPRRCVIECVRFLGGLTSDFAV